MKHIYFTVGPSQIYKTIPQHTRRALADEIFSLNHRSHEFEKLFETVCNRLRVVLGIPKSHALFFLSSGTEAMERVIQNGVDRSSVHIVSGSFGKRFFEAARQLGKTPIELSFDESRSEICTMNISKKAELIAITHNDTSTGYQFPMEHIYHVAREHPHALIALDTVSSMPHTVIDYNLIDYVFFSIQKGFGLPAGLGIVVVSPRALEKARFLQKKGQTIGTYHNFIELHDFYLKNQTPETPNVFAMYLLAGVLQDFINVGIDRVREHINRKAQMMYEYFDNHTLFSPVIKDPRYRSLTTLVIDVADGSANLISLLNEKGIVLGSGYGAHKNQHVRIANFPAHTLADVRRLLNAIREVS